MIINKRQLFLVTTGLLLSPIMFNHQNKAHANVRVPQVTYMPRVHTSQIQSVHSNQHIANAYDVSQWQGNISQRQADNLHHEVNFMIVRIQGGDEYDQKEAHNQMIMQRAHMPYGAYSFSYYTSPWHANGEAKELYYRAPKANFYVNDIEQDSAGNTLDQSTYNWGREMHHLTRKPVVLYSDYSYLKNKFSDRTLHEYDAIWLADYGYQPDAPFHYDLWQNSNNTYSPDLQQNVDSDVFPYGYNKELSFWTGSNYSPRRKHKSYHHSVYRRTTNRYYSTLRRVKALNVSLKSALRADNNDLSKAKRTLAENARETEYLINKYRIRVNRKELSNLRSEQVSDLYYQSPRIHTLTVKAVRAQIYNPATKYSIYVARGTRFTNVHFYYRKAGNQWITRAVGTYHNHPVIFTSNRRYVEA